MTNKNLAFVLLFAAVCMSVNAVSATNFANDLGQWQFNSTGKYSTARQSELEDIDKSVKEQAADVVVKTENSIQEVSNTQYQFKKGSVDTSSEYGVDVPYSGVNASRTMYTDGIGRLHFFRKDNQIHE